MKEVGTHRNIVSMLGYWIQSPPIMLIMEYVPNGDLLRWLRNKRQQVSLLYKLYQIKICCPLFCLLFKKNTLFPVAIALSSGIIHRTQTQTNKFLNFVCLFVIKMSSLSDFCLFVLKITKMADIRQILQISFSDVINVLCCTLIFK